MSRRVLVFAYYFPPMGFSGVQRISKFVKYLPEYGWEPVVLTAEPRGYFAYDEGLRSELDARGVEIHATQSIDPTRLFARRVVSFPPEWRRKLGALVSSLLFVPDNKRSWLRHAVREAVTLHRDRPFDAVLATAPPYTALLAGERFSSQVGVPLVSDFRDDWLGNPRHTYPTGWHRKRHEQMEARVIEGSRQIVAINDYIASAIASRNGLADGKMHVLPQGYDPDDIGPELGQTRRDARGRCCFLYTGTFYHAQKPDTFLAALRVVLERRPDLRERVVARFVGTFTGHLRAVIDHHQLDDVVFQEPYVEHARVRELFDEADVLWMTVGRQPNEKQLSTGKLFEYLGTLKPVLGLVPSGAARDALEAYSAGFVCDPDDVTAVAGVIERLIKLYAAGDLPVARREEVVQYDRRLLTKRLGAILEKAAAA